MQITKFYQFNLALANGAYAFPGGYPLYFRMADGEALSFDSAVENAGLIRDALISGYDDQWRVIALETNWETPDLFCSHSGLRIPSAYAEDEANEQAEFNAGEVDKAYGAMERYALETTPRDAADLDSETLTGLDTSVDCHNTMLRQLGRFMDENAADLRDAMKTKGFDLSAIGCAFYDARNWVADAFVVRGLRGSLADRLKSAAHEFGRIELHAVGFEVECVEIH
jgi:hypothetical protein